MDGELGGVKQALLETRLGLGVGLGRGSRTLPGLASDLPGEGNLSACDRKPSGGWRPQLPGPYPSAPKAGSKLQVAPLG